MKHINKILWKDRVAVLILPALLVGGLFVGGCSNDPVGPHDAVPALSAEDVATQAGFVAMAASVVAPQAIEFSGKADKDSYTYPFTGNIVGAVQLDFFSGGAGGTSVPWDDADYVEMGTGGAPIVAMVGVAGAEGTIFLSFNLTADLDRVSVPNTATVSGSGIYASGPFNSTFSFDGLVVESGGDYPGSGTMTFTGGGHTMTVTYDGDSTAMMAMSGGDTYVIDLDTGMVTVAVPVG
jgi:hypothetical protein